MGGFLNYLDNFDNKFKKNKEEIVTNEPEKKSKVLCLNVEVRSVDGAKLVIEKLQNWISENKLKDEQLVSKKPYKIIPKKIITNPINEARHRAINILDGLPEEIVVNDNLISEQNSQININTTKNQIETVSSHASSLL